MAVTPDSSGALREEKKRTQEAGVISSDGVTIFLVFEKPLPLFFSSSFERG